MARTGTACSMPSKSARCTRKFPGSSKPVTHSSGRVCARLSPFRASGPRSSTPQCSSLRPHLEPGSQDRPRRRGRCPAHRRAGATVRHLDRPRRTFLRVSGSHSFNESTAGTSPPRAYSSSAFCCRDSDCSPRSTSDSQTPAEAHLVEAGRLTRRRRPRGPCRRSGPPVLGLPGTARFRRGNRTPPRPRRRTVPAPG